METTAFTAEIQKLPMNGEEWFKHYKDDILYRIEDKSRDRHYESLCEVTISAFTTDAGQVESSISVLNQRRFKGRKPVIPSSLSDTPCRVFGVAGLLAMLNTILNTSYTLHTACIYSLLVAFITKDSDFGTAYAYLRPFWYRHDFTDVEDKLRTREEWDLMMREDVFVNKRIISELVPPRRVWDLYSNRVVAWWAARGWPYAISHAWVEEKDRMDVLTPINGYEWPVPIPKDTNLDLIRIEMLNAGAEYAWLDVLCLRQVGGRREDLRAEEWKVDVPTIGRVYTGFEPIVYYFNGLGRPLRIKAGDFESDRNWFKRVWTLQEVACDRIIGGDTGDDNAMAEEVRAEFDKRLLALQEISRFRFDSPDVWTALSHMRDRVCTYPVDRIAGLVYLLDGVDAIPAYYEMQSMEDAWTALVDVLGLWNRTTLFFTYPRPGNRNKVWRPSWSQVMNNVEVLPSNPDSLAAWVQWTEDTDSDWVEAFSIESGYVQGLAEGSHDGKPRQGELIVTDDAGTRHTFSITVDHQYQIPDGLYAFLGSRPYGLYDHQLVDQYWVVGRRLPERKFEKVSVFQIAGNEEVKRLDELNIAMEVKTFLA
ncbi:hypothetical protein ARMSODRAFT_1032970 [Armillaria solidipes]|uniref:Heterokaryon incompatibility domain-containing protein n=1 Tax=Armillaria solidipes TaxID=1076256 RepID=A0A2H3AMN7_9AGAR|nr:hypothetical protein ARMSODRAFT_1032970 [Armillaria solidipes]